MCARLLACPLCSQPGFLTLDALRAGLVSAATRPLVCPVCNEVLLGIDKLTIHLFGHTINSSNLSNIAAELPKTSTIVPRNHVQRTVQNEQIIPIQAWNILNTQPVEPKATFVQDGVVKYQIQAIRKIQNDSSHETKSNFGCNVPLANSQIVLQNQNQSDSFSLPMKTTSQVIFVENLSQLQQCCAENVIDGEPLYESDRHKASTSQQAEFDSRQNISEQKDSRPDESQSRQTCTYIAAEHSTARNAACQSEQTCTQNTSQLQQAWTLEQKCSRNELTEVNDTLEECVDRQLPLESLRTVSPIVEHQSFPAFHATCSLSRSPHNSADTSRDTQESLEDMENSMISTIDKEDSITAETSQQQSPDRNKVLPQLRAFRAIAVKTRTERCNICGFNFPDRNILDLHKQLVHMIDEKDLDSRPEDFLKNYPCHLCSKIFKMRGTLMVHMRVAHMGYNLGLLPKEGEIVTVPGENGYNCPTCGKNFKKEQHVTQHLKTHEGKQWECDVCSKMFTTKYFLKKHKRLHSGEMPYKCSICDKTFTFQQSYHKHRLYHKDDKPHTCTTCGRSFKELSTLHNHERIHTGEKPFACETCGKCFRQRVSYLVHRRIHTGAMPYKCTACGKSFRYKVSQRTHKCTAQPPGTVVRQSSDLVQRLIQVSQMKDESINVTKDDAGPLSQDHHVQDFVANENNKFVLIVDSQGQHILTRHADVKNMNTVNMEQAESDSNLMIYDKGSDETFIKDLWGHNIPSGTTLKESMEISTKQHSVDEEKSKPDNMNDFFSMVMSPTSKDIGSPSSEMEHLRLSSPTSQGNSAEKNEGFVQNQNNFEGDMNMSMQGSFRESNDMESSTINEESLKQLLYGSETGQ